ncbi:MAG: pyrroline-5-carboxylate reductase [Dermabacter sp.]|nr:pyrroline-5-carboxylate reductase [Dermabacter sp.]
MTDDLTATTVLVLGAGAMGAAVATAALAAGVSPDRLLVLNQSPESSARAAKKVGGTSAYDAAPASASGADAAQQGAEVRDWAVAQADVVILGVKPYQLASVLPPVAESLGEDTLVLSLAAGATLERLQGLLGGRAAVVRAMPNTPVAVGAGVVALMAPPGLERSFLDLARALVEDSADVIEIDEAHVHAEIAAAGSAPAFFFLVAEAMIDEAVAQGLRRDDATAMVVQTMLGSARLLKEGGQLPAEARYQVTSPGGTTARGVAALESSGIRAAFARAMRETAERSRELESQ